MVLAYVTNVLVKMNMFKTRCMLFYFAKTIEFVSWGNIFPFVYTFFWGLFSSPTLFAATGQQPTCSRFPFSAEQYNTFSLSFWAYGFICGWPILVSSRSAKQPGWRSPPILTILTIATELLWGLIFSTCHSFPFFFLEYFIKWYGLRGQTKLKCLEKRLARKGR